MADTRAVPTVEELRRIYTEGIEVPLLSGTPVRMHPVQLDRLLRSGKVPDILTPIVIKSLYEDTATERDAFLFDKREEQAEILEMVASVDAVCEAALVDPSIVPYLDLADRMWIFRLAFLSAEAMSRFRGGQAPDVEIAPNEQGNEQQAERAAVR